MNAWKIKVFLNEFSTHSNVTWFWKLSVKSWVIIDGDETID